MFSKRKITWFLAVLSILVLALVAAGCSSSNDDKNEGNSVPATGGNSSGNANSVVNVEMTSFAFKLDKDSVPAGQVTFHVKNSEENSHEMKLVKTDLDAKKLPTKSDQTVDELQLTVVGKVQPEANQSQDLTVNLTPGHYVVLCNLPGHYASGMAANFTVK